MECCIWFAGAFKRYMVHNTTSPSDMFCRLNFSLISKIRLFVGSPTKYSVLAITSLVVFVLIARQLN